jgi:Mn2+/Fe2+ NRAMP family transporter
MADPKNAEVKKPRNIVLRLLGPGLVTGAADDDPSGIATYSQAGAQFGYGLLWTVFLTTPFMIAIQLVSARIGRVTGRGLAANVMELAPRWLVLALVFLLVAANTFNIAADIAASIGREKAPFKTTVEDYYLTNPIARASAVMAECSRLASGQMLTAAE